ncbi:MAG: hypothetical protein QG635_2242 [Bacteroidota bacterium]|nr:hypothetical protein [Bacteroidota bacterium]
MEYQGLIHEFVDGTLPVEKEDQLFLTLASNEESRSELKQQLAIGRAIRGDVKAYTPSGTATMKIYNSLGFSPNVLSDAPAAVSKSTLWELISKYSQGIIGGIIAAAATALILLLFLLPAGSSGGSTLNHSTQAFNESVQQSLPPAISQSDKLGTENIQKPKTIIKYIYVTKDDASAISETPNEQKAPPEQNLTDEQKPSHIVNYPTVKFFTVNPNFLQNGNSGKLYPASANLPVNNFNIKQINTGVTAGITFEIKNSQSWFLPQETIQPSEYSKFNNLSAALLYSLSKYFLVGLDFRQETFYQVFEGTDEKRNLYRYEQQPNITSLGMDLRFAYKDLFFNNGILYPIGQIYLGGTGAGFIGRGMLGFEYSPYNGIGFILGAEYSGLFYQHQGNNNNTGKIGMHYGIVFGF